MRIRYTYLNQLQNKTCNSAFSLAVYEFNLFTTLVGLLVLVQYFVVNS